MLLKRIFGQRFLRALNAIFEKRVKAYIFKPDIGPFYVVVGEEKDYLVIPEADYCSCKAMSKRMGVKRAPCYHLIALELAKALNLVDKILTDYEFYDLFMSEFK